MIIDRIILAVFLFYVICCLWFCNLTTAIMITPLILLSGHALLMTPKAICLISKNKDTALDVMGQVAKSLDVDEVHVYVAHGEDEILPFGIYDEETDTYYEFDNE